MIMNDIEKTTRRMSSFASVDELMKWIRYHQCGNKRKDVAKVWLNRVIDPTVNYRMMVVKHLGRKYVVFEKQHEIWT